MKNFHIHEVIAKSVFIFIGSYFFQKLYSWVHKFHTYEIHKFVEIPIFRFMGSCFFCLIHIHESRDVVKKISDKIGTL